MERMYFLATWGKEKEKAWSGTNWSLHQALGRHYSLQEVNIKRPFLRRVFNKLFPSLHDMELGSLLHNRKRLKNEIKQGKVFQFQDICEDSSALKTYIYKDLSVSYLEYVAKVNPAVFAYSGFAHIPMRSIERKAEIERAYHRTCSGIFTMSSWLRDFLIEHDGLAPEKVHHVGGGINIDQSLIKDNPRGGNKILFTGRDFERKGGKLVYEAFKLLKEKMHNVELHVAGPAVNPVQAPVEGYYYYGDMPYGKLPSLLNQCDLFCMPSHFEAYGLVFPESLCYGLPCIGRRCYEMPRFIESGTTGLLLEEENPVELAEKMGEILTNRHYAENVGNRRAEYLRQYSWTSVAERICKVIS